MPIYEYQCPQCRHLFEEWVKASDAHGQEPCPRCGAPSPRVISQTSFVLKGGGWYVSDYGYRKGIKEEGDGSAQAPSATGDAGVADAPSAAPPAAASAESPAAAGAKSDAAPKTTAPAASVTPAPKAAAAAAGGKTGTNAAS